MGGKGQLATYAVIDHLFQAYASHYNKYNQYEKIQIREFSVNKNAFDCSGFVGHLIDRQYILSQQLIDECYKHSTDLSEVEAGCLLWKPGHIGVAISTTDFMHFPTDNPNLDPEFRTCAKALIDNYNWVKIGWHPNVDYGTGPHHYGGRRRKSFFTKYCFRRTV